MIVYSQVHGMRATVLSVMMCSALGQCHVGPGVDGRPVGGLQSTGLPPAAPALQELVRSSKGDNSIGLPWHDAHLAVSLCLSRTNACIHCFYNRVQFYEFYAILWTLCQCLSE